MWVYWMDLLFFCFCGRAFAILRLPNREKKNALDHKHDLVNRIYED